MQFSFSPQCIQVANFYSYCKENISFLVDRKFFARVKKKIKKDRKRRQSFISDFMEGFAKPLTS